MSNIIQSEQFVVRSIYLYTYMHEIILKEYNYFELEEGRVYWSIYEEERNG